jgi:hypothetical protein
MFCASRSPSGTPRSSAPRADGGPVPGRAAAGGAGPGDGGASPEHERPDDGRLHTAHRGLPAVGPIRGHGGAVAAVRRCLPGDGLGGGLDRVRPGHGGAGRSGQGPGRPRAAGGVRVVDRAWRGRHVDRDDGVHGGGRSSGSERSGRGSPLRGAPPVRPAARDLRRGGSDVRVGVAATCFTRRRARSNRGGRRGLRASHRRPSSGGGATVPRPYPARVRRHAP